MKRIVSGIGVFHHGIRCLVRCLAGCRVGGAVRPRRRAWPAKPIQLLVPLAAGEHGRHRLASVGTELAKRLGQPVVVENKPGAGGTIAMAEVARAAPDGYTIGFASQGTLVFNQALYSTPGYDSSRTSRRSRSSVAYRT